MAPSSRRPRGTPDLGRLFDDLTDPFPDAVWQHALRLRWPPRTLTEAVEAYWTAHPLRADRLARALAARSGPPPGWTWTLDVDRRDRLPTHFRTPPAPYREHAHARGHGACCLCGQPVFRHGWHRDLWADGRPSRRATWHLACAAAWKFWVNPRRGAKVLRRVQTGRCGLTGKRLLRLAEVDHRIPLYRVWREHRETPWPELLAYWGAPNLHMVNAHAHRAKSVSEAKDRTRRQAAPDV